MRDIPGFVGQYTIDEDGNVYSLLSHKYLSQSMAGGYPSVNLQGRGTVCVHTLITKEHAYRIVKRRKHTDVN